MGGFGMAIMWVLVTAVLFAATVKGGGGGDGGVTYVRPPARKNIFVSPRDDRDDSSPEQVHISLVGNDRMRISWITSSSAPSIVKYGTSSGSYPFSANGSSSSYHYILYHSGEIHEVVIGPLQPNTIYYYRCGPDSSLEYNFKTPPSQFPIKFAISGDLGQTEWTRSTLDHISKTNYDVLLLPGDLSYADMDQSLWDSFGRLVEPLASQRPWMVTQGNHEVEKIPLLHSHSFTSYNARWHMPFEESSSSSNLFYSFEVSGVHVVMLGSYTDFEPGSDQYKWLYSDLRKVDRKKTPWLIVLIHAPWYNSNHAHQGEREADNMKDSMEELLYNARVDLVFAGHVHAYERFSRVYKEQSNNCGPIYINIGDGGNREGLASRYMNPQPKISVFREASFGHGELQIANGSHALWAWHRNQDDETIASDTLWITSLGYNSACKV